MKTMRLVTLLLFATMLFTSCLKDQCTETRTFERWNPVYRSQAQLDAPISLQTARSLEHPGIIYFYKQYIMINEWHKGIHIIDNSDQTNPVNETFLEIEGNEHFAVIDDHLQANKYGDLLTINIKDVKNPVENSRIKNVFLDHPWEDPTRGFLVGYSRTEERMTLDCSSPNFNSLRWSADNGGLWLISEFRNNLDFIAATSSIVDATSANGGSGVGGSTARFTIANQHLYMVTPSELKIFDLVNPSVPVFRNRVNLGWGIETIYPFKDRLFIGSNRGMHVFDIGIPTAPEFLSMFEHATACDPVVADDSTAYVTLHDGTECNGFANQLDVIAVDNILSPQLLQTYAMKHPHGLALAGDILYVAEGRFGLKVLDVGNREKVVEIDFLKNVPATDVIALPNETLLVIGETGLKQFDVQNPGKMRLLSEIPVVKS